MLFGREASDRRQQERAKPAAIRIGVGQIVLFQERREKALRQIAGIFRLVAAAAKKRIERIPIGLAQDRPARPAIAFAFLSRRRDDQAPLRRMELRVAGRRMDMAVSIVGGVQSKDPSRVQCGTTSIKRS